MKFIVWVKDNPGANVPECYSVGKVWVPNGEGALSQATAERIARETSSGYTRTRVLPVDQTPV